MSTKNTNEISERLAHSSRKFARTCDQIRMLKRRISELIGLYGYYENMPSSSGAASVDAHATSASATNAIEVAAVTESANSTSESGELIKEFVRREIESLQRVKSAYLMYAYRKADEITRLQCELYGEDAVREAYQQADQVPLANQAPEANNDYASAAEGVVSDNPPTAASQASPTVSGSLTTEALNSASTNVHMPSSNAVDLTVSDSSISQQRTSNDHDDPTASTRFHDSSHSTNSNNNNSNDLNEYELNFNSNNNNINNNISYFNRFGNHQQHRSFYFHSN
jgi:hypothetical protein